MAIRTFVNHTHKGATIERFGDDMGAISALASGRGVDAVLCAVSRAIWFHSAKTGAAIKFSHKPGEEIPGADTLSRVPLSEQHREKAHQYIRNNNLSQARVFPAYINYNKYM